MRTLFFGLVLSFVALGCDEVYLGTQEACLALVDECFDELVPEADELYCLQVVDSPSDIHERRRQCDAFRRGQLCQCITPVCVEFLLTDAMALDGETSMDTWGEIYPLQCPRLSLTH